MLKNGFCLQKWYYSLPSRTSIVPHLPLSLSANNNNNKNSEGSTFHCRFVLVLSSCECKKQKQKNLRLGSQIRGIGPNAGLSSLPHCQMEVRTNTFFLLSSHLHFCLWKFESHTKRFLKHATANWCSSLCVNNNFLYHLFFPIIPYHLGDTSFILPHMKTKFKLKFYWK